MVPTKAVADESHFPAGARIDDHQCYGLEEYKELLKLHSNYDSCLASLKIANELIALDKKVILNLEIIVDHQDSSIATLKVENKRLFGLWKEENRLRHKAENETSWTSWAGWIVAGVATIVAGGAVTYAIAK